MRQGDVNKPDSDLYNVLVLLSVKTVLPCCFNIINEHKIPSTEHLSCSYREPEQLSPCKIEPVILLKCNKMTQRSLTSIYLIHQSDKWTGMLMRTRRGMRRSELLWCQGDCGAPFNPLKGETLRLLGYLTGC